MIRSILFDKTSNFPSVRVSLHSILMKNKLKTAGKSIGVLSALTASVAQGADLDQLKAQYEQQMAQAPDAVMKVLQSGEGCDVSLLNHALETDDYTEYIACGEIEVLSAQIESAPRLAYLEQALASTKEARMDVSEDLASEDKDIAELTQEDQNLDQSVSELTQGNQELDKEHEQDKTMLVVLSKEKADIESRILASLL